MRSSSLSVPAFCLALAALLPCALSAAGCGRPSRPAVMAEAEQLRKAAALEPALARAPEAVAHADKLRADADHAYAAGDPVSAQILSERAIAAYEHARVLSRVAIANERLGRAKVALADAEKKAGETEAEQKQVAADTADLEARLQATQAAEAVAVAGATGPARERAKLVAARTFALDARMLCAAAQMLGATPETLAEPKKAAEAVSHAIAADGRVAPLDAATRARADCLSTLTLARRAKAALSSLGRADELLAQISAMGGLAPSRDERGVVVTLRGSFDNGQLRAEATQRLRTLGRVAQAHPDFPVQILVHAAKPGPSTEADLARQRGQADLVAKALVDGGAVATRIGVDVAAGAHPILAEGLDGATRNERVEITFVDPGG